MSAFSQEIQDRCLASDSQEVLEGQGLNRIPPAEKESLLGRFFEKFKDPLIIILCVALCVSVGVTFYEIWQSQGESSIKYFFEPMGILFAILLATGVGFVFEVKAEKEFEVLNQVKDAQPAKVLRRDAQGHVRMTLVKKCDVVKGDVVRLESGDQVPADGILLETNQLRIDESNFTGELYADKAVDPEAIKNVAAYPCNFVLRGSTVIEGSGICQITAIGVESEEGKGVMLTREGSEVKTPLNQQLDQLGKMISVASMVIGVLIVIGRILVFALDDHDDSTLEWVHIILDSVMIAVTLIVVAVPEGLPMSITVSLAMSMRKMLKENSLVRKLHACETMGAATVICTDKTGTLTQNKMSVVGMRIFGKADETLLGESIVLNSTASLTPDADGKLCPVGNPTEGALLMYLNDQLHFDFERCYKEWHVVSQQPFSSETKFMETVAKSLVMGREFRFVKGAPEIVLQMCEQVAGGEPKEAVLSQLSEYQSKAMRTLGIAMGNAEGKLEFVCIVGIADPIREDVKEAIDICKNHAGVKVIIVTGDTPGTANEIGRQLDILQPGELDKTFTGQEFAAMSDKDAKALLREDKVRIIARARPEDKARLVTLLQQNHEVVAVTGDGTNDAPALSKAQVGLSMGSGTSRAKEASDITIIDDSFVSINKAIMWGRSIYQNIRRFILYQMTINVCACLIVLVGAFLDLDSPLNVTQMLWVNLIMDTFAAMALSSLPAEKSVLEEKPRNPKSHIINRQMAWWIVGTGLFFSAVLLALWHLLHHDGAGLSGMDHGLFFTTFVIMQFWNLFNARYFHTGRSAMGSLVSLLKGNTAEVKSTSSGSFIFIAAVILVGQFLIVECVPQFFEVEPIGFVMWFRILLYTFPILLVPEIIRFVSRKK